MDGSIGESIAAVHSTHQNITKRNFFSLLQERQQLVDCMGRSECAVNSSLKRKLSSAPVGDAGNRSVRQRMDDWPSTLRAEGTPGHEQPVSPLLSTSIMEVFINHLLTYPLTAIPTHTDPALGLVCSSSRGQYIPEIHFRPRNARPTSPNKTNTTAFSS